MKVICLQNGECKALGVFSIDDEHDIAETEANQKLIDRGVVKRMAPGASKKTKAKKGVTGNGTE